MHQYCYEKIIDNYWTRLSKISWFVSGETLMNYDILWWPSSITILSFNHQVCFLITKLMDWKRSATFTQEWSREGEKHGFIYTWVEYYLQSNTVGQHRAWADHYMWAVICRSCDKLSPMKRNKNLHEMIIIDVGHSYCLKVNV